MTLSLLFFVFLTIATDTSALNCTTCMGNGLSCRDQGTSKTCQPLKPGQLGACGHLTYKVNGTQMVTEMCTLDDFCVGSIDCYKDGFEFAKGKVGYDDCIVTCCNTDNCEPPIVHVATAIIPTSYAPSGLTCNNCSNDGNTCKGNTMKCPGLAPGEKGGCGRITYKVNGTAKVMESCILDSSCGGSIDCYDKNFGFPREVVGYSDCIVSCCHSGNNCDPKAPLKCNECTEKGEVCADKHSVSCAFDKDRCINVKYNVDGVAMAYGSCFKSSDCDETAMVCNSIGKNYANASFTDCKPKCCEGDNCTGDNPDNNASLIFSVLAIPFVFVALLLQ